MNPEHLTSLFVTGAADDAGKSPACPDDHVIAGYVDGGLEDAARQRLEMHVADCQRCLALVGFLSRERTAAAVEPVSREVLAQARALVTKEPARRWWRSPQWAAAAMLVVAVPLLMQIGRNPDRGSVGQGRPEPPVTRTITSSATGLRVLSPGAGGAVDPQQPSFRWTEVPGTPYYDVRIVTDAGDVVIQQRVAGTSWRPPAHLDLQPGADYFVHVDAYPAGDKAVSSDHVPFRVSD